MTAWENFPAEGFVKIRKQWLRFPKEIIKIVKSHKTAEQAYVSYTTWNSFLQNERQRMIFCVDNINLKLQKQFLLKTTGHDNLHKSSDLVSSVFPDQLFFFISLSFLFCG